MKQLFLLFILTTSHALIAQPSTAPPQLQSELKSFFDMKFDKFSKEKIIWYQPKFRSTNMSGEVTYLYFGTELDHPTTLRMVIKRRHTNGFLLIDKYRFNIDGEPYELEAEYGEIDRQIGDDTYREWGDMFIGPGEMDLIIALKEAKQVEIQYYGNKGTAERTLSKKEVEGMQKTIYFFEQIGGKL